jgi:hypothetical protein
MTMSSQVLHRRQRRRRQLALFLTLAVIVAAIALAVRYRTEQRDTGDYLALTEEIAQDELLAAQSLRELFDSLGSLDRPEILQRIELLGARTAGLQVQLSEAVVTRPAAELHGLMAVATRAWNNGVQGLDEAVVEVMEQPDDSLVAPDAFLAAVTQLRVGDEAYAAFLEAVPLVETDVPAPDYPEVAFVGGADPVDLEGIASRLRLRTILGERHDIAVTANTVPEPTGDRNGVAVLPYTPTFDVTAIVTNAGNVTSEQISVTMRLSIAGTDGGETFEEQRFVAALDPEASVSLEFLSVDLEPGTLYTLQVVAEMAEDADIDNNVWEVMFATNDQ